MMKFVSGFGIEIKHNYQDNYFVYIDKGNNEFKLWLTRKELEHIKKCINEVLK
jgi:hypothetical protein